MAAESLDASTRLALERTRLANERTLMAWIRTCTSLIAFGFTIFKFFQYLDEDKGVHRAVLDGPAVRSRDVPEDEAAAEGDPDKQRV